MPHARLSDPTTSVDAANSVNNIPDTRETIHILLINSMTDEELVVCYNKAVAQKLAPLASPSGIRTRRSELVSAGRVVNTGQKRKLASGRNAIVWKAVYDVLIRSHP